MLPETLNARLDHAFSKWHGKIAVTFVRGGQVETRRTYGQLDHDVSGFAGILRALGVTGGDRIIVFLEKSLIAAVAMLAVQRIGAIAVPLNPGFKESEMRYLLHDAGARLVLSDPEKSDGIRKIDPAVTVTDIPTQIPYQDLAFFDAAAHPQPAATVGPDDPGLIIYTSGTTGNPKGAVLTGKNLAHDAKNIIAIWQISSDDVLCHALPLFHIHGLCFALHTALLSGAGVIMLDRFDPETVLDVLSRKSEPACSVFMAVPAMYTRLMDHLGGRRMDFSHVRLLTSGSAPLRVRDFERITRTFGREPVEREGMSETGMNFSNPLAGPRKPGSIGLPLPQVDVRIVDPDTGSDVPSGQTGEIRLRGPGITPGYWGKPVETAGAFAQGWFKTGDLGRVDDDGYYYLTDRIKHIIITGGENVSAKEVETVIDRIDGVVESAVVGIPDRQWGERVVAAVTTRPGTAVDARAVQSFCRQHLHDWKCPKAVMFLDEIPKNTMGKVLKEAVKKRFTA